MAFFDKDPMLLGMSPDQVERLRMSSALAAQRGSSTAPVSGVAEGLARLVDAWGGYKGNLRADEQEKAGIKQADELMRSNPALAPYVGGQVSPVVNALMPKQSAQPQFAPDGSIIRQGLIDRGLPEHVADAFVMNFQDESGLNPGINEQNPTVAGSRGGFGLAQWTGPRRVALEQFAAQRGAPVGDMNTQLDYLMTELQGPESAAAQAIMGAGDTGSAADAILRKFLRPAAEHQERRSAQYLGGAAPQQAPSATGVSPVVQALMQAQSNPWVQKQYGPVIQALMQQEMGRQDAMMQQQMARENAQYEQQLAQQDPMYQAKLDAILNPAPERQPLINAGGGSIYDPNTGQWINAPRGAVEPYSAIGKLEADRAAGRITQPQYEAALADMAPKGMTIESDGQGGFRMVQGAGAGGSNVKPFTEGQSKDNVFSTRARGALADFEPVADALMSRKDIAAGAIPLGLGRGWQSDEYQKASNSGREFLQAILRKDTGAAITPDEEDAYGAVYLPLPGDGEAVRAQKKKARERAIAAIEAGMSPEQMLAQEKALGVSPQPEPAQAKRLRFNPETGELE